MFSHKEEQCEPFSVSPDMGLLANNYESGGSWHKVSFGSAPSASPSPPYYAAWEYSGDTNDIVNWSN